ncbi:hypothetical protein HZH66_005423 [Vespula vulgaris]|uniref:Uncharacterized protein n=1 Tax=Vespula vulgaris TaxID=7454 RepID=A0A834KFU3_VESVU|nr:hypothetical protein HZH66_005423 [Vespula vulgaris]
MSISDIYIDTIYILRCLIVLAGPEYRIDTGLGGGGKTLTVESSSEDEEVHGTSYGIPHGKVRHGTLHGLADKQTTALALASRESTVVAVTAAVAVFAHRCSSRVRPKSARGAAVW